MGPKNPRSVDFPEVFVNRIFNRINNIRAISVTMGELVQEKIDICVNSSHYPAKRAQERDF